MGREFNRKPPTSGQPSMANFARAVAEGVVGARDRFGNPIKRGHMVTYRAVEADPVYEVVDIAPILDPRQPNMVRVTLAATLPLRVFVNQSTQVLTVIGTVPTAEDGKDAPPPEAPPDVPSPDAPPPSPVEPPLTGGGGPTLVLTDADQPVAGAPASPPDPVDAEDRNAATPGRPDDAK